MVYTYSYSPQNIIVDSVQTDHVDLSVLTFESPIPTATILHSNSVSVQKASSSADKSVTNTNNNASHAALFDTNASSSGVAITSTTDVSTKIAANQSSLSAQVISLRKNSVVIQENDVSTIINPSQSTIIVDEQTSVNTNL